MSLIKLFIDKVHPDDREFVDTEWKAALEGKPYDIEHRIVVDNKVSWVREKAEVEFNEKGIAVSSIGFTQDITERKRSEEALNESEDFHRLILTSINDSVFLTDYEGEFIYICLNVHHNFGYTMDEVRQLGNISKLFGSNLGYMMDIARQEQIENIEIKVEIKDGLKRYLLVSVQGVSIRQGNLLWVCRDITDRKQAQEALQESELKYRTIFENAPLGIFRSTPEGRFLEVNPALTEMLGYNSPQEVLDKIYDIAEQIYVSSGDRTSIVDKNHLANGVTLHTNKYKRANGTEFLANLHLKTIRDNSGTPIYLEGMVEDITDQKKAEDALQDSEEKYRNLVENVDDIIWKVDLDLRTIYISPSIERMLGFTPEERMKQSIYEQMTPSSVTRATTLLSQELASENKEGTDPDRTVQIELEYYDKEGNILWFENNITGVRDEEGVLVGIQGVSRNITDRKIAERALKDSQDRLKNIIEYSGAGYFYIDKQGHLRIPVKAATHSGPKRPPVPIHSGHPIRSIWPTCGAKRRWLNYHTYRYYI